MLYGESLYAQDKQTELLIIGGGASGTTAAIQASRMGIATLLIEETTWLGGMLTSAGVSAIDGNHQLPSGLWGEFRNKLYQHYGGPDKVETGWVSNTLFEPSVGNQILQNLASHKNLTILYNTSVVSLQKDDDGWRVGVVRNKKRQLISAKLIIDATELGDVAAMAGVMYDVGMDDRDVTGEPFAPAQENNIVQDLTYVAILKDYGPEADMTIAKPPGYDPQVFDCACDISDPSGDSGPNNNCRQMMHYAKLPQEKYMINWPKCGNDTYVNVIEDSPKERVEKLKEAKLQTLRFIYYIQTMLGYKNLGLARGEFPTKDLLPMIPYHRESRRIHGLARMALHHIADPFHQEAAYYRTGIAVGDYPIDHHHYKKPEAPAIEFLKIKVPSYNIPLGALIPKDVDNLIIAEKSISVTNIVNGTTRLQPVVLGIGQAAGALAAISLQHDTPPRQVNIREVQQALLDASAYIMPYIDTKPADPAFQAMQRIGATGILKGKGIPYKWANQTWFYPDDPISQYDLLQGLKPVYNNLIDFAASGEKVTNLYLQELMRAVDPKITAEAIGKAYHASGLDGNKPEPDILTRREIAILIDYLFNPFLLPVDFDGHFIP